MELDTKLGVKRAIPTERLEINRDDTDSLALNQFKILATILIQDGRFELLVAKAIQCKARIEIEVIVSAREERHV